MSARRIISRLRGLVPTSEEFYDIVARYYASRSRSHRFCGFFFVFMAGVAGLLVFFRWGHWLEVIILCLGVIWSGFLGYVALLGCKQVSGMVPQASATL